MTSRNSGDPRKRRRKICEVIRETQELDDIPVIPEGQIGVVVIDD